MISFMFFATNPSAVYTRLVARGWIEQYTDMNGVVRYRPTIPHVDITELPTNPVQQSPGVPYPQTAIAVRISYDRLADETSEDPQYEADGETLREQLFRTKIGAWVRANSTAVEITGYTGNSQAPIVFPARKLDNVAIWVIRAALVEQYVHNWL